MAEPVDCMLLEAMPGTSHCFHLIMRCCQLETSSLPDWMLDVRMCLQGHEPELRLTMSEEAFMSAKPPQDSLESREHVTEF